MALGTGIGQARALLRRGGEDWWMKRLAADMQAAKIEKAKQKAKQQEELTSVLDFKIDYGKYLPAWGREVAGVYADFINDVATMRQQDPNISPLSVQVRAQEAKRRIGELEAQNEMAKKYLQEKDIMRNEQFDKALVSFESTFESLNKMSNTGMYNVSPNGGFNYRQIPSKEIPIEWGQPMQESLPITKGGYRQITMEFPGGYESYITEKKKKDPIFRNQVMFILSERDKGLQQADNETDLAYAERMDKIVDQEIENIVKANRPPDYLKFETIASSGGGGSGREKTNIPMGKIDVAYPYNGKTVNDTWDGKNVNVTRAINISNSGQAFSVDKNEYLPKNLVFNFKPQAAVIVRLKGGEYKKYAWGVVTKNADGTGEARISDFLPANSSIKDKEKWSNTYNILIPYDNTGVSGLIEEKNSMQDFYQTYDNMTKGKGTPAPKGGTYTKAQEQGIQNVMSKNNISRQEAIDALKAAGKL